LEAHAKRLGALTIDGVSAAALIRFLGVSQDGDGKSNESDIEVWFDASAGLHLYVFDWRPSSITWYVDGVEIRHVETGGSETPIPRTSSRIMANVWAANKHAIEWVGEPAGPGEHSSNSIEDRRRFHPGWSSQQNAGWAGA